MKLTHKHRDLYGELPCGYPSGCGPMPPNQTQPCLRHVSHALFQLPVYGLPVSAVRAMMVARMPHWVCDASSGYSAISPSLRNAHSSLDIQQKAYLPLVMHWLSTAALHHSPTALLGCGDSGINTHVNKQLSLLRQNAKQLLTIFDHEWTAVL